MSSPAAAPLDDRVLRFRKYARVLAALAAASGVVVFIGWALDVPVLKSPIPPATMKANTAVAVVLLGIALWLSASMRGNRVVGALVGAAVLLSAATASQDVAGWDLGIDELLIVDRSLRGSAPGRMAPTTASCFVALGAAMLCCRRSRTAWLGHALAIAVALFGSVVCLGYLYGVPQIYGPSPFTVMATHTAALLLVLALGVLFGHPSAGLMNAIASGTIGGAMARRVLPVAILAPFAVGTLWLGGARGGFFTLEIGVAAVVVSMIVVLSIVIWWSAGDLMHVESERRKAVEETRALNAELNARVVQRTRQLEAANKELEAFSYSVSHDLRAPLRHIDGFSKILLDQHSAALDPGAQRYLTLIRSGAVTMGRMIDDLLQMARVDRQNLSFRETDLNEIVAEVREELRADVADRRIEWEVEDLPVVVCDPGLVKLVFANLISNAIKYTRGTPLAHIRIALEPGTNPPVVVVQDNGAGFDPRYADKLFGVFQRLHRAEDFEGTGIGLATVQRIVQKHGGRVWADAAVDKGATFSFTLSPAPPAAGQESDTLEQRARDAG